MTQDGFPIYDKSESHPGAFVLCCHSGVTLCANHALTVAPMIAAARSTSRWSLLSARGGSMFKRLGEPARPSR